MGFSRKNVLRQDLDVAGSENYSSSKDLSEEIQGLGESVGNSGSSGSITVSGSDVIVTGLSGITGASLGRFLTFSGAASGVNNSTFLINKINSATSVNINHSTAVTDGNNGSLSWVERKPYTLEDDINFSRTDRSAIKSAVGLDDNETDLSTKLTNTTNYYPFSLLDADPTVVEALNILNQQFGNLTFSGSRLDGYDGYTITEILQVLSDTSGTGNGTPAATQVGQILYSVDGSNFTPQVPITSPEGWLVNNDGILIVVG